MSGWFTKSGPMQDVVISSRVRLARNFKSLPFPTSENIKSAEESISIVKKAVDSVKNLNFKVIDLGSLPQLDQEYLVEIHMMSTDMVGKKIPTALVIKEGNENLAVMVNEEDHLRIQSLMPGLQLEDAYKQCLEFEGIAEFQPKYAFSHEIGYLTSCPTNTGTGLRASAMVHLPALEKTDKMESLIDQCRKMGVAVRGFHGENTKSLGSCYQISNQVTMGFTEHEIISGIDNLIKNIIQLEREARETLRSKFGITFDDMIFRAYGILTNARMLTSEEALRLLSELKLGIDLGMFAEYDTTDIIALMSNVQPASLQKISGKILSPGERDILRANIIREKLKSKTE
ncbi:MAG TPA: protein arginine kinase [Clostridiaceae bacterium]|jgi:protein arginine kinase|nr:protein arginine kinase [Clostridiaceae bacterium]